MAQGFALLFSLQLGGELLARALQLPLPGSVIGLVLLLMALRFGWLELDQVKAAAELLLQNLSLLFIPAGVGVMVYFELIAQQWLPLLVATLLSTLIVLTVTGRCAQWLIRRRAHRQQHRQDCHHD